MRICQGRRSDLSVSSIASLQFQGVFVCVCACVSVCLLFVCMCVCVCAREYQYCFFFVSHLATLNNGGHVLVSKKQQCKQFECSRCDFDEFSMVCNIRSTNCILSSTSLSFFSKNQIFLWIMGVNYETSALYFFFIGLFNKFRKHYFLRVSF